MNYLILIALVILMAHSSYGQHENNFIDSLGQTVGGTKEELIKIKENYYLIQPTGIVGNIAVYTGSTGVVMVDAQWAKLAPRIKELISTVTDKPVRSLVNTHFHFDHVDGNKAFGRENVTIIAHTNLRERLLKDRVISGSAFGAIIQKAYPTEGLPTITFNDTMTLYDGNETIRLIHFPNAHTDGDAIVHFKTANIYHTGDIFVTYGLPVIDEANGGDIYAMIQTIEYLLSVSNSDTRFIPGHGPVCSVKELSEYRMLLTSIKDQVVAGAKKGLSLEKITEAVTVNKNVGGIDRNMFIGHVYRMVLKHEKMNNKKKSR
ncbi:MBL fold metallo-hydrolase [Rhodocytophaga rosea]|uniref:MBL fold metallo-hydrolase n=1 Tax=Rhodocytophaga rosea TaxID=2704465 RepID=A0A6C0GDR1_9BACT|nr:MBL fold metallo-hydrolase [Rhodocytophaga rosea]QHT65902.1 MBL fold metallo-hydrolase [Rhodocytophaga rosea]